MCFISVIYGFSVFDKWQVYPKINQVWRMMSRKFRVACVKENNSPEFWEWKELKYNTLNFYLKCWNGRGRECFLYFMFMFVTKINISHQCLGGKKCTSILMYISCVRPHLYFNVTDCLPSVFTRFFSNIKSPFAGPDKMKCCFITLAWVCWLKRSRIFRDLF